MIFNFLIENSNQKRKVGFQNSTSLGFTIVEVLIAVVFLGLISLAVASIAAMITQSSAKLKYDHDANNDIVILEHLLSDEENCTGNFKGLKLNLKELVPKASELKSVGIDKLGNLKLKSKPLFSSPILKGLSVRLDEFLEKNEKLSFALATLYVQFESQADVLGTEELYREIILTTEVDKDNKIQRCVVGRLRGQGELSDSQGDGCDGDSYEKSLQSYQSMMAYSDDKLKKDPKAKGKYKDYAKERKEAIKDFCKAQNYPMKKAQYINLPGKDLEDVDRYKYGEEYDRTRGPYKSRLECETQFLYSEGDKEVMTIGTRKEKVKEPEVYTVSDGDGGTEQRVRMVEKEVIKPEHLVMRCINHRWIRDL